MHPLPNQDASLLEVVERLTRQMGLENRYQLEIDIAPDTIVPVSPQPFQSLVRSVLQVATESMSDGDELSIISWESDEVLELEIADSGPSLNQRTIQTPTRAMLLGAELSWADCPQGGVALTLQFSKKRHSLSKSA